MKSQMGEKLRQIGDSAAYPSCSKVSAWIPGPVCSGDRRKPHDSSPGRPSGIHLSEGKPEPSSSARRLPPHKFHVSLAGLDGRRGMEAGRIGIKPPKIVQNLANGQGLCDFFGKGDIKSFLFSLSLPSEGWPEIGRPRARPGAVFPNRRMPGVIRLRDRGK
jgi:hypothetical protein